MSKIEVDAIDKQSGSTLTLGGSGTAVTLACGATESGFGRTGTVDWQTSIKTAASFTAVNGEGYFVDTSSNAVTANLPAGSVGAIVAFKDYAQNFDTNALTIAANGSDKIEGQTFDLVLDTGAEQMVLSQETAEMVRVRAITKTISAGVGEIGLRGLDLGRADSLQVGSFRISNLPAIIKNPPLTLTGVPTPRVRDSFSPLAFGFSVVIDYRNQQIVLKRRLTDEPPGVELPMRINRLAVVQGLVNGEFPKSFVVDTGGEVISISTATAEMLDTKPQRRIPLRVFGTSGWDRDAFLLPGIDLSFRDIKYNNFSVVVLDLHPPSVLLGFHIGGIVGHTFLSNYRVAMDLERSTLRLSQY